MKIDDTKHMSRKDIGKLFGVNSTAVTHWFQRGDCPRNQDGTYNLEAVIEWRKTQGATKTGTDGSYGDHRTRKIKAEADKVEIQVDLIRKDVIPIQTVKAGLQDMLVAFRGRIMNIARSISPVLAGMDDSGKIQDLIEERHIEALEELSTYNPDDVPMGDDEVGEAPKTAVGQRMGRPRKKA